MSAPTRAPATFNGQDGVKLREHLEDKIAALDRFVAEGFASRDKALDVAFRAFNAAMLAEMKDEITRQLTVRTDTIAADIRELRKFRDNMEGKATQSSVIIALALSLAGIALTIAKWLTGG